MKKIRTKSFFLLKKILAIVTVTAVAFSLNAPLAFAGDADVSSTDRSLNQSSNQVSESVSDSINNTSEQAIDSDCNNIDEGKTVREEAVSGKADQQESVQDETVQNELSSEQKKTAEEAYEKQDPEFFRYYTIDEDGEIKESTDHAYDLSISSSVKSISDASISSVNSATLPKEYLSSNGYVTEKCLDVSHHQDDVNWSKVKKAGINNVILRCGYRVYGSTAAMYEDTKFSKNIIEAHAAGLKIGIYFFSQAITTKEAKEEAEKTLSIINGYRKRISLPVAFDFEYTEGRLNHSTFSNSTRKAKQTDICETYCDAIKAGGYTPMIYASKTVFDNDLDKAALEKKYKIWMAHYTFGSATTYKGQMYMWQYSSTGKVNGISGNVDMNYLFSRSYQLVTDSKGKRCKNPANGEYAKSQWVTINGKYYYAGSDGYCCKGFKTISGKKYYFNSDCSARTNSWLTSGGEKYYCGAKGLVYTGLKKAGSYYYYFSSSGVMQKFSKKKIDGKTYRLRSDGVAYRYKCKASSKQTLFSSASAKSASKGTLKKGGTTYLVRTKSGWGQTKKGYWVKISALKVTYAYPYEKANYKVKTTDVLNIRKGPSSSIFEKTGSYKKGKTVKIVQKKGSWGKVADGKWICLTYTKKV